MSRSVLLQLARDSIQEVLEAKVTIDRDTLIKTHPLLGEMINTTVNLYIGDKLRGKSSSNDTNLSLIDDIILNAKKAAFQDKNFSPLSTTEYLECELELLLSTPDGIISEKDASILSTTTYKIEDEL